MIPIEKLGVRAACEADVRMPGFGATGFGLWQ
jgi:hypothetical protein